MLKIQKLLQSSIRAVKQLFAKTNHKNIVIIIGSMVIAMVTLNLSLFGAYDTKAVYVNNKIANENNEEDKLEAVGTSIIETETVLVLRIAHRKEIYRK